MTLLWQALSAGSVGQVGMSQICILGPCDGIKHGVCIGFVRERMSRYEDLWILRFLLLAFGHPHRPSMILKAMQLQRHRRGIYMYVRMLEKLERLSQSLSSPTQS